MGVPFKKIPRKDPRKADSVEKFYPQLVTLGPNADLESIAYVMKEKSSLTLGDIQSVLTNFVEAMRSTLYGGQSVNIKKNIKAVKINFRPSTNIRPDITTTRAGEKIDFYDLETLLKKKEEEEGGGEGEDPAA